MQIEVAAEAEKAIRIRQSGAQLAHDIMRSSFPAAKLAPVGYDSPYDVHKPADLPLDSSQTIPVRVEAVAAEPACASEVALQAMTDDMTSFVEQLLQEGAQALSSADAAEVPPAAASSAREGSLPDAAQHAAESADSRRGTAAPISQSKAVRKPAWALTEQECSKLEVAEEDHLLGFAEELDFDAYIASLDDTELVASLEVRLSGWRGWGPGCGVSRLALTLTASAGHLCVPGTRGRRERSLEEEVCARNEPHGVQGRRQQQRALQVRGRRVRRRQLDLQDDRQRKGQGGRCCAEAQLAGYARQGRRLGCQHKGVRRRGVVHARQQGAHGRGPAAREPGAARCALQSLGAEAARCVRVKVEVQEDVGPRVADGGGG